jgi:hypothetical protein
MPFVNEYIPEADYARYDLRRVCGEHNLSERGHMYRRDWTVDRESNVFLIQVWSHREAEFNGWALFWRGTWIFFELKVAETRTDKEKSSFWARYALRGFSVPAPLANAKEQIRSDLGRALSAYAGGGVFATIAHRSADVDFVEGASQ